MTHDTLEQDRHYASELLADLDSKGENLSRIEKATRWFRKARRENALLPQGDAHQFKNFHRMLCERFNYCHDEKEWRRDQVSLIEHISANAARDAPEARSKTKIDAEGLTGREHSPWLCHVTPKEVYTTSNRILDLIQESDPFGDRITQHELRIFSQAFADLGNSQALFRFQHGLDLETLKDCPVCGGDCASANPPVINCPRKGNSGCAEVAS